MSHASNQSTFSPAQGDRSDGRIDPVEAEAHVERVVAHLTRWRRALVEGRWLELADHLSEQDQLAAAGARLVQRGGGTNHSGIALSPRRRDRLKALAAEAATLSRQSALLCQYHLEFVEKLLADLSGGVVVRYGPAGTLQPTTRGALFEARG